MAPQRLFNEVLLSVEGISLIKANVGTKDKPKYTRISQISFSVQKSRPLPKTAPPAMVH